MAWPALQFSRTPALARGLECVEEGLHAYGWAVAVAAVLKISTSEGVFAGWNEQLPELSWKICMMKIQELDTGFQGPWDF